MSQKPAARSPGQGSLPPAPSLRVYLLIFLFLIVVTVAEVGIVFLPLTKLAQVILIMGSALAKAFFVAGWYMHLAYDWRPLWPVVSTPLVLVILLILALIVG